MNNLTINQTQTPFNFLAVKPQQSTHNGHNLAWITDRFYLADNNYFIYTCSNCPAKQIKKGKKPITRALTKAKNPKASKTKNTLAYYQCMCHQTKQGLKGKKITGACHDCKHNALAINSKMSAQKIKDVQKLAKAHADFKQILEEYVQKH